MFCKSQHVILKQSTTQPVYKQPKTELDAYLESGCTGPVDLDVIEDNPDLLNFRELLQTDPAFHSFLDQTYLACKVNIDLMGVEVRELLAKIRQVRKIKAALRASDSRRPCKSATVSSSVSHTNTNYQVTALGSNSMTISKVSAISVASVKDTSG